MVKPAKNWRVTRKRRVSVEVFVAFKSACLVLLPTHNLLGRKLLCAHTLDCVSNGVRLNTESIVRSCLSLCASETVCALYRTIERSFVNQAKLNIGLTHSHSCALRERKSKKKTWHLATFMWNDVPVHLFTRSKCALDPRHSENSANWKPVNCVFFLFCCCCFHRFVISNCFSSHIWLSGVTIISLWKQNSTNHTPTARRQRFTSLEISTAISCHTVCTNFEIKRNNQIAFFFSCPTIFLVDSVFFSRFIGFFDGVFKWFPIV